MRVEQPVHAYIYRQIDTQWGPKMFTDICLAYDGDFYGSRCLGALSKAEIVAQGALFLRRRITEKEPS